MTDHKIALIEQKAALVSLCALKLKAGNDWHGVADCAMDIREIDAKLELLTAQELMAAQVAERRISEHSAAFVKPQHPSERRIG